MIQIHRELEEVLTATAGSLRELDLSYCYLSGRQLAALAPKLGSSLEVLVLDNNSALDDDTSWAAPLAEAVKKMTNLRKFSMRSCEITHREVEHVFAALASKTKFTTLDVAHNFPDDEGDYGADGHPAVITLGPLLAQMPSLEALDMSGIVLGKEGADAIINGIMDRVDKHTAIFKELKLSAALLTLEDFEQLLFTLHRMTDLRKLSIQDITIPSEPSHDDAAEQQFLRLCVCIGCMEELEELRLTSCNILRDEGLGVFVWDALAQSLMNKENLKLLSLYGNEMEITGATAIARCLPKLTALEHLILDWNHLGKDNNKGLIALLHGIDELSGWLEKVTVRHNGIEDRSFIEELSEEVRRVFVFE